MYKMGHSDREDWGFDIGNEQRRYRAEAAAQKEADERHMNQLELNRKAAHVAAKDKSEIKKTLRVKQHGNAIYSVFPINFNINDRPMDVVWTFIRENKIDTKSQPNLIRDLRIFVEEQQKEAVAADKAASEAKAAADRATAEAKAAAEASVAAEKAAAEANAAAEAKVAADKAVAEAKAAEEAKASAATKAAAEKAAAEAQAAAEAKAVADANAAAEAKAAADARAVAEKAAAEASAAAETAASEAKSATDNAASVMKPILLTYKLNVNDNNYNPSSRWTPMDCVRIIKINTNSDPPMLTMTIKNKHDPQEISIPASNSFTIVFCTGFTQPDSNNNVWPIYK